jgi:hypothetical protein
MKRLLVLLGVLALVAGGTAIAFADDPAPATILAQSGDDDADLEGDAEPDRPLFARGSLLAEVLGELVEEDVLTEEQAEAIEERLADKRAECDDCRRSKGGRPFKGPHGFGFPDDFEFPEGFPFPEGFELPEDLEFPEGFPFPEGFELPEDFDGFHFHFPDGFDFRGPIEIPEEVRDQLRDLVEQFESEFDVPFGRKFLQFPGGSLRDFLDDGELSEAELDELEAELRERLEDLMSRFEDTATDA